MKNKGYSIIFSILVGIIVFVISFAVFCPQDDYFKLKPSGESVYISEPSNAFVLTQGSIDADGNVRLDSGKNCVIEFMANGESVQGLSINFAESNEGQTLMVENTVDGTFVDCEVVHAKLFSGEKSSCVALKKNNYKAIRIWFQNDCKVENITFYKDAPSKEIASLPINPWRYVLTALLTILSLAAGWFIDKKFDLLNKMCTAIKKNYMQITKFIIGGGLSIILGIVAELIFRAIYGADSVGNVFNVSSCTVFCVIFFIIFIFITQWKSFELKPEKIVFFVILASGMLIILSQSFSHTCWDIDSHYMWAVKNSYFNTANYTDADIAIRYNTLFQTARTLEKSLSIKTEMNEIGELITSQVSVDFSIAHVPSGIFIAIARLFGADFYTRYIFGQIPNIFIYATVIYFAIKKLKIGKMIMAFVALLPTNIFIASNYSYDYWVTSFAFLGIAYFISEVQQPDKPITTSETLIMCVAFALATLPKQIYVMLLAIPMFMFKNWQSKKEKKKYYLILVTTFVIVLILFIIRAYSSITGPGDIRGGDVNPSKQIAYIFANPLEYTKTLIKFLVGYFSISINGFGGYAVLFSYLGVGKFMLVYALVLGFVVLTDKDHSNKFKGSWLIQVLSTLLLLGGSAVIATALFVAFTPVGFNQINGCQPRYIVPILMPFLLTIANPGITVFKRKAIYNGAVLGVVTTLLLYNIVTVVSVPMM